MKGRLVILSGPSGVGKDTVIDAWVRANPSVERVVAATTRPPRPGERDGVDYRFLDRAAFESLVARGALLEHKLVHGNWYGTPIETLDAGLAVGKTMILKIDVQGALSVMPLRPDAITIFLLPPNSEELERRLRARHSETAGQVAERLTNAREEIAQAPRYQHQVVNSDVEDTVRQLEALVHG
jgi:guanylate kinase